jgi:hypothetical protein
MEGWNLMLSPVPQRYSAYTPYLDERNAVWLRNQGPRYLVFDGYAIDRRHPWAETPATWLEVYRWYDTRLLAKRNLLLERRSTPRFTKLVSKTHFQTRFSEGFEIPAAQAPVFWTLDCPLNAKGQIEKLLFRVPEVLLSADRNTPRRVIPDVLTSPVMGSVLPENLTEFATLMTPSPPRTSPVRRISFTGPGLAVYASVCQGDFLVPVP